MGIETTARSRELGAALKRHRDSAGLRCEQVGAMMGLSANSVSRMERGHRVPSEIEATIFLAVCGVGRQEIDELLAVCKVGDSEECWLRPHSARTPDVLKTLVFTEATAIAIQNFQPVLIPGLLQSEDYAAAVMRGVVNVEPDVVADRVAARMSRQRLLYRQEPPQCHFFINEVALRCPVGGPRVMHEQMLKLLFASDQPHITVRVVPLSAGAHAGMRGPFMMMRFAENRPVVHVETEAASLFHESSADIELYQVIVSELSRCSLDEEESRSMFAALANEHDRALGEIRGGMASQLV